jgi:tetratricopeptide (TPR) repeat protein
MPASRPGMRTSFSGEKVTTMSTSFEPTVSKDVFVGRDDELTLFDRILEAEIPQWIIQIPGQGGLGKTRLLQEMADKVKDKDNVLVTTARLDMYNAINRTDHGLLDNIVGQLGRERFPRYGEVRGEYEGVLSREGDPVAQQEAGARMMRAFLDDYADLLRQEMRIVLLFDTCERIQGKEPWVLFTLLPQIARIERQIQEEREGDPEAEDHFFTTAVFAGRTDLRFPAKLSRSVKKVDLQAFDEEEVRDFYAQGELSADVTSPEVLGQLRELTGGRPLYVALVFDWLKNRVGTVNELLEMDASLGEKLVTWVLRLRGLDTQAILYAAVAWRRMETSLLARLLRVDEGQAADLIAKLGRFSFVKFRPPHGDFPGDIALQDEFRDLLLRHVWPHEGHLTQQALLPEIIAWYEEQIDNPKVLKGDEPTHNDNERALVVEWLYYQTTRDLDIGFALSEPIFRQASHQGHVSFCELINQEMWQFDEQHQLKPDQREELNFRDALVAFRRERYTQAKELWLSLARNPGTGDKCRATSLMQLVELVAPSDPDQAIEYAERAEALYLNLMDEAQDEEFKALDVELGQLYNNWGYACRVQGHLDQAHVFYGQALSRATGRPKNQARTLNNIGYIYYLKGELGEARAYVRRALQIRSELNHAYELGLGHNTMGIILDGSGRIDEAAEHFHKALASFKSAESERGQAMVYIRLGQMSRVVNDFDRAIEYLQNAVEVFREKNDADNLILALNELGCAYRERGGAPHDFRDAEEHLERSFKLSRRFGKAFEQADNLEDLSILYYGWAVHERMGGDLAQAAEYETRAETKALEAQALAEDEGYVYLKGKTSETFGELALNRQDYDTAFDHFLEACRLMGQSRADDRRAPVLLQRRYDTMVDRLQQRLLELPDTELTKAQVARLLARFEALDAGEQASLHEIKTVLDTANRIVSAF